MRNGDSEFGQGLLLTFEGSGVLGGAGYWRVRKGCVLSKSSRDGVRLLESKGG